MPRNPGQALNIKNAIRRDMTPLAHRAMRNAKFPRNANPQSALLIEDGLDLNHAALIAPLTSRRNTICKQRWLVVEIKRRNMPA